MLGVQDDGHEFMSDQLEANNALFADAGMSGYSPFAFDELLPTSAHFDIFHTFDSEAVTGQKLL